ncbi:MAG: LysE family transporter [Verrucomicrobiota bacterium]|jgi:threonine/homoserine/homoserine lactone efflux protein
MLTALSSGFLLGLSCALAPGPLLALLLAQTLRHGPREGCKVALAPLVTDAPIILVALALAAEAARVRAALAVLSLAGGLFVLYLAVEALRAPPLAAAREAARPGSWLKAVLVNLLNPHPWLFWMTVGAAMLARARTVSNWAVAGFLGMFYLLLVGSKLLLALGSARSRQFLSGRGYRRLLQAFAIMLAAFAVLLLREGLSRLSPTALPP